MLLRLAQKELFWPPEGGLQFAQRGHSPRRRTGQKNTFCANAAAAFQKLNIHPKRDPESHFFRVSFSFLIILAISGG